MSETRFDRTGKPAHLNGRRYVGVIAREHRRGDGLPYDDGRRVEYRDLDACREIAEAIQAKTVPLYLDHPSMPALKSGAKIIGRVSEGRLDGDKVVATIDLLDDEAIKLVASGMRELSMGYMTDLETVNGEVWQRRIRLDHVALTPYGRCGGICAIKVDVRDPDTRVAGLTGEEIARAAMIDRIANAWRPNAITTNTITTKNDHCGCHDAKEKPKMNDEHRAELETALKILRPGVRTDDFATVEIARQIIDAIGDNDVFDVPRNDYFAIVFARGAITSKRHANKFGGGK